MSGLTSYRTCPHCGGTGESHANGHLAHGGGHLATHFGLGKHGHPLALIAGLGVMAYQMAKSTQYVCGECGRKFTKLL